MKKAVKKMVTFVALIAAVSLYGTSAMAVTEHLCELDGKLTLFQISSSQNTKVLSFRIENGRVDCMNLSGWEIDLGTPLETALFLYDENGDPFDNQLISCPIDPIGYSGELGGPDGDDCVFYLEGNNISYEDLSFEIRFSDDDDDNELVTTQMGLSECALVPGYPPFETYCIKDNELCTDGSTLKYVHGGSGCYNYWAEGNPWETSDLNWSNYTFTLDEENVGGFDKYSISGPLDLDNHTVTDVEDFLILAKYGNTDNEEVKEGISGDCTYDGSDIDCDIDVSTSITENKNDIHIQVFAHSPNAIKDNNNNIVELAWYSPWFTLSDATGEGIFLNFIYQLKFELCWVFGNCPQPEDPNGDIDGDGIKNSEDNCKETPNPDQLNTDDDDLGDECDPDIDGDGYNNNVDKCDYKPTSNNTDMDGDGEGDECDDDIDGDGLTNTEDNCPRVENPSQENRDGDLLGDACDSIDDGPQETQGNIPSLVPPSYLIGGEGDDWDSQAGGGCALIGPSRAADLTFFAMLVMAWGALLIKRRRK